MEHWQAKCCIDTFFCGEINNGKADGFHARPGGEDPDCAGVEGEVPEYLPCFKKEKVLDAKNNKWIYRKENSIQKFCFFPKEWTTERIVEELETIYNKCIKKVTGTEICAKYDKFIVVEFLDHTRSKIVSGFAIPLKNAEKYCQSKFCKVNKKDRIVNIDSS